MYPNMNALLVASCYFSILLLLVPGILAWTYEEFFERKTPKNATRVIHFPRSPQKPKHAA